MSQIEKIGRLRGESAKQISKRSQRKDEIAASAIDALQQLGYARTSLRDIAEHSGISVGMLHYYFDDKVDLISFCVRKYKSDFIAKMDRVLLGSANPDSAVDDVARALSESIRDHAETHRLWYDIRNQALFDESFRGVVVEIEDGLIQFVNRLMRKFGLPRERGLSVYIDLDGAFRFYLQRYVFGDAGAVADFRAEVNRQLSTVFANSRD